MIIVKLKKANYEKIFVFISNASYGSISSE